MADWTPEELAEEKERMADMEASGLCPYSGLSIRRCWTSDLCDCAFRQPFDCTTCEVSVWDLADHTRRRHEPGTEG